MATEDSDGAARVVDVLPLAALDRSLAYAVPERLREELRLGSLVRIPLRNRAEMGVVSRLESREQVSPDKLKQVQALVHEEPVLTPELLRLAEWMRGYYAAHTESILEAMIPAAIRKGAKPKIQRFIAAGRAPDAEELAALERRAPKQAALLQFLQQQMRPQPRQKVLERLKVGAASCDSLVEKGLVAESTERVERSAYDDPFAAAETVASHVEFDLTEGQAAAVADINRDLDAGVFGVRLIHGVTGSGKTEVYLRAVDRVLAEGGSVLFLVPEVALAPQTVGRIRSRLEARGVKTVVWHSHLSEGERYDAWRAVARGEARVVVGARSAVFAPVKNLRLIVVDEEHEPAYKQEDAPRYHGRDVAVYRAYLNGCPCLL
ncbi:MAG: DEAD/DEAH box helicase, partial [Verrucomicrobiota bacterium]